MQKWDAKSGKNYSYFHVPKWGCYKSTPLTGISSRGRRVLEGHGEPVRHDLVVAPGGLDGQSIELQKLQGVVLAVVAWTEVWPKLDRPDDAAKAAGERNRRAVGDHTVGERGAEVTPCGGLINMNHCD